MVSSFMVFVIGFVLGLFYFVKNVASSSTLANESDPKICLTPGCVKAAADLLDLIDVTADPCEDFFHFACGNFIKKTQIPEDQAAVTQFSLINDIVELQLRTLIEEPIQKDELSRYSDAKILYKICMNTSVIEKQGLDEIKKMLKQVGGYPVLERQNWDEKTFDWIKTNYKFWQTGFGNNYFFDLEISVDKKNSTQNILLLNEPSLDLKREFLVKGMDERIVSAYYNYIVDIAVMFGANKDEATAELYEALQLQIKIANMTLPAEKKRDSTAFYNPMTIAEIQKRYPGVPWLKYINAILGPHNVVTKDEVIIVSVPEYMTNLLALLKETPKRVQANFMINIALLSNLSYLTKEMEERLFEFSKVLKGTQAKTARWKHCVNFAAGSLSIAVGGAYVKRYFNETSKKGAEEMIGDLKVEFIKILKEVDWMDDKTREKALEKAREMNAFVGYPSELMDDNKILEFYKELEIVNTSYLSAALSFSSFEKKQSLKEFRQLNNKTDWRNHCEPADVNAYYSTTDNAIELPAGILQGAFFNADRPKYLNYGAIGFIIGHEISHGFDDEGKQFDKNGNLVNWWETETKKQFNKRAQCIIEQYDNYSFPEIGLNLNGIKTQGENIADNGGLKAAFYAYQKWINRHGHEPILPGLNYTPNQLFYLSAASIWCAKERQEYLKLIIITASHTAKKFRVNGPVSNSDDFRREWNCPLNSKMNPVKKCKVW